MNKVILIGNLTRDPELRQTQSGVPSCRFTLAVNGHKNKDGVQHTDFIRVVAWQKTAEVCGKYLTKGRKVGIEGALTTRNYEKDGEKVYVTEVRADNVEFLTPRDQGGGASLPEDAVGQPDENGFTEVNDSELPF